MKNNTILILVVLYILFFRRPAAATAPTVAGFTSNGFDYSADIVSLSSRLTALENQLKNSDFA